MKAIRTATAALLMTALVAVAAAPTASATALSECVIDNNGVTPGSGQPTDIEPCASTHVGDCESRFAITNPQLYLCLLLE